MRRRDFLHLLAQSALAHTAARAALGPQEPGTLPETIAPPPRSPVLAFNQVGYLPAHSKIATIPASARGLAVLRPDASIALRAPLGPALTDAASGDHVRLADFSALRQPGLYRLQIDPAQATATPPSAPFAIAPHPYRDTLRLTARAYYGQRCGCSVNLGDGYQHPPCHLHGAYHPTSGNSGPVPNHGGWHDAGDYGRYVVNSGITMGTLLWAWELYQPALQGLSLEIPESGGKTPDFLAEIRWNLAWALSLQDADGGVWHKQTSEAFCGFVMPQDDHLTSFVIGTGVPPFQSTCATADLAAVAAIAARAYAPFDPAFAAQCLAAARRAWAWCLKYPNVPFDNPPGITTGSYADPDCRDELAWAAAELWRTTGEAPFLQALESDWQHRIAARPLPTPAWSQLDAFAAWTYLLAASHPSRRPDPKIAAQVRAATHTAAQSLLARSAANAYGNTLAASDYIWGSNSVAANHSLLLLIANHIQPDPRLVEAALANLHYLLGRNCFALSWITHAGSHPFQHPHHRPSIADAIPAPWPGLLSGGPNAHPGDAVLRQLPPAPPMRMYIDNDRAYSCNEIAINWNAPLVFLLAAADSLA